MTAGAELVEQTGWPPRRELFGVRLSVTHYAQAVDCITEAARQGRAAAIDFMPVHGLVTAARDPEFRALINHFQIVAPDGQPVRWALNRFHQAQLRDRVYGPELMRRLCEKAAQQSLPVYLYGSTSQVLQKLSARLQEWFPNLQIAGAHAPPFRPLTDEEDRAVVQQINSSGARIVFIGTGCPRQEQFAFQHRQQIAAPLVCVGAAFDFHAGVKKMAPAWMQRMSLEWLFRLCQEPRRLGRRYLVTNSIFLALVARQSLKNLCTRQVAGRGGA